MTVEKKSIFTHNEFACFSVVGLDERMEHIRQYIQPKFSDLAAFISKELASELDGVSLPVHVAKHLQRTKYAPESTWVAIGGDARGYKKYPHFQIALDKTAVYIWLAFIDNPQFEKEMSECFLQNLESIHELPEDYIVSLDHTKEKVIPLKEVDLKAALKRWQTVKKGEFMMGRYLKEDAPILKDGTQTKQFILETVKTLLPLYQLAYLAYPKKMIL